MDEAVTSLCEILCVIDERMISHAGCRNAYTNTFSPPLPQERRGEKCKQVTAIGRDQCPQTLLESNKVWMI